MAIINFRRKAQKQPETIKQAFTIGDTMFIENGFPNPTRGMLDREIGALARGASGVSDAGLAQAIKLSVPAYTCLNYFATTARSVPLTVDVGLQTDSPHHIFNHFMLQAGDIIELSTRSMLLFGKVFLRKLYNEHGYPTGLEFINPNNIRQDNERDTGRIIGYTLRLTKEELLPKDIIYIKAFDPSGDGNPLSAMENAFINVGVSLGTATYAAGFFSNGAVPVGIVSFTPPIMKEAFEHQKRKWKLEFQGSTKAHKTGFTNGGVTWTPITAPVKDLAMTELSDQAKQDICAAFGVPQKLVGLGDNSTSSLSQQEVDAFRRSFLENTVIPFVQTILSQLALQWTWVDFSPPNFYTIQTNEKIMPILSNVTLDAVAMSINLVQAGTFDFETQRDFLGIKQPVENEDRLYIAVPSSEPRDLWKDGLVTMNQALMMLGLPIVDSGNIYSVSGANIQVPADDVGKIFAKPSYLPYANPSVTIQQAGELAAGTSIPSPPAPAPETNPVDELPADIAADVSAEEDVIVLPPLLPAPSRNLMQAKLAIDFSEHNLIKQARRVLSKELGDMPGVTWADEQSWRIDLMVLNNCGAGHIAKMMRDVDLSGKTKIELRTEGYKIVGDSIYWSIGTNKDLSLFNATLLLEIEGGFGLSAESQPLLGIKLCDVKGATADMLANEMIDAPLVVDNVTLFADGGIRHKWLVQRVTEQQRSELRKWREKYRTAATRSIPFTDVKFEVEELPQHVVDYIQTGMIIPDINVNDVFAEARTLLNMRAIQSTRLSFETIIEDLVAEARAGNVSKSRFGTILRNEITRFGRLAYRDGLIDGGVLDASTDAKDKQTIEQIVNDGKSFVKGLGNRIFSEAGITDVVAADKPRLWFNSSILPLYNAGLLSANKNGMYEFVRALSTEDNCGDCDRLEGQVHRLKDWAKRDLLVPKPGQNTECDGWNCGHQLVRRDGRASGNF